MLLAALYDIHANLPALEAVLEEVRRLGVERILVGGDVLPGPMPRETMACLADFDLPIEYIRGNGDREVLARMRGEPANRLPAQAREAIDWNARELGDEHEAVLASWPMTVRYEIDGLGRVLFCHATPRSDSENFTKLTPEERLLPMFEGSGAEVVVCGHTHMQFDRMIGRVRIMNAGSVGMPFGEPGAYWLLVGPDGAAMRKTNYDLEKAAARVRETRYPQAGDFAEGHILTPPKEDVMLAMFERSA